MFDKFLTPEIKTQLEEIEEEFAPQFGVLRKRSSELENRIKEEVIAHGETIKGEILQAV